MKKLTTDQIEGQRLTPEEARRADRLPVSAVLDNIRSLYNVGSIFRTADAAMVRELVLTGYTPRPPRKEIEKTALGATKTVPWIYTASISEALRQLRSKGHSLYAVEMTDTSVPLFEFELPKNPFTVVFGNEIKGVSEEAIALCDGAIQIPMYGTKHSLNVAVAFGVTMYEISRRQRGLGS